MSALSHTKIICKQHGEFYQAPDGHLIGKVGCRSCSALGGTSNAETELAEYISTLGVEIIRNDRSALSQHELDVYIPSQGIAFEFNGLYWHSEEYKPRTYHYDKFVAAREAGIRLIQVWEDDWRSRRDIVERHIAYVLGLSTLERVMARKTQVVEVSYQIASEFLDKNHIQGSSRGSIYLGLVSGSSLVAVAVFKKRGIDYELTRYATSCVVVGGHSKLVTSFEKTTSYSKLITFADLSYSAGDLYRSTQWIEDYLLEPNYSYLVDHTRKHKSGYRKERFKKDPHLKYVEGMTERELAKLNGLLRVYDAGKIRFIKPHP